MVKNPDDLRVAMYLTEGTTYELSLEDYHRMVEGVGEDGIVLSSACGDPLMGLLSGWMGVQTFSYLLADCPQEVDKALRLLMRQGIEQARVAAQSPCEIFQVGGNIHAQVVSPKLYREYALPFFQEVTAILHEHGKFAQYHFDGDVKPLLPLIDRSGLDAIEAFTPVPQADATLEEVLAALNPDVMIQGGIPTCALCAGFPERDFQELALRTIELARETGRVAIAMGDNISPDGLLDRARQMTEWVEESGWF